MKKTKRQTQLEKAITALIEELNEDADYRFAWQANIAMAFYDEYRRSKPKNLTQIAVTANEAAKNFLDILCQAR